MQDSIVLTSIYSETEGTRQFMRSCANVGLPVHNAFTGKTFTGNGDVLRMLYKTLLDIKGFEYVIYSDGADTFFTRSFRPEDKLIYSTEKAYYPLKQNNIQHKYTERLTPWCYLNGGGWCAPVQLAIEFFQKTGLNKYSGDVNGQHEQHLAFFQAKEMGLPVDLDQHCKYFQTVAFADPSEFELGKEIKNLITGTYPCVFHGNGRTNMDWVYATDHR